MTSQELLQDFYHRIPLSQAMGLEILHWDAHHVLLQAPLLENRNHVGTAFGGSIYSLGALTCYALFRALILEQNIANDCLVIQRGAIEYLQPASDAFQGKAIRPSDEDLAVFFKSWEKFGKARLSLRSQILCRQVVCAEFSGDYVLSESRE